MTEGSGLKPEMTGLLKVAAIVQSSSVISRLVELINSTLKLRDEATLCMIVGVRCRATISFPNYNIPQPFI